MTTTAREISALSSTIEIARRRGFIGLALDGYD